MKRLLILSLLILLLSALLAQDQSPLLSYEEAKALALANNSDYQARLAARESARWSKNQALSAFLPNLSLSGTLLYMDPATEVQAGGNTITLNNDFRTFNLQLSQPLFTGGKIWQAYKMAEIGVEMADLALQNQELTLLSELENKYLAVLQTRELLDMNELDYRSAETNLEIATLKKDAGIISNADYLRFESNLASKEVSLLQAQSAYSLAQMSLRDLLRLDYNPVPAPITTDPENPLLQLLQGYDSAATTALALRARAYGQTGSIALKISDRSLELSRRSYKISQGAFLPTVALTGSRQYQENGRERWEFEASNQIMLNVSIPLLPQVGNYSAMRKSYFDLQQKRYEAESLRSGVETGMEASVLNLVSAAKQVKAASLALSYTQETYEQMQERFRLNMISGAELLDIDLMLSAARLSQNNSFYNYLKALAALKQLLGITDTQVLNNLIQSGDNL
ncbi:MAG: TolC family protein [Candidatus Cloacimonadota bacterium]